MNAVRVHQYGGPEELRYEEVPCPKPGPGEVLIPGLLKLNIVDKPATPKHEGVNPFTKEPMTYKAKPARKVIKVRTLKALKDAI